MRYTEVGSANTELVSTLAAPGANWRLIFASVVYSAAPTQAGVTFKRDSGAGAAHDTVFRTGDANAQYTNCPDVSEGVAADRIFGKDDGLVVTAPAGGVGITAAVELLIEHL